MSVVLPNLGGTMTGGASATLASAGNTAGKASFVTSDTSRLTPKTVDFLVTAAKSSSADPGVARSGLRITFANRTTEEGCCTVSAGLVGIDVNLRWHLSQPESLAEDAIEYLQSLVFTQAFKDALLKGTLPS